MTLRILKRIVPTLGLTLVLSSVVYADSIYIYDDTGRCAAYIQGRYIYNYYGNGERVAYIQGGSIYSFKTGRYLGYIQGNHIYWQHQ
jgi:hypothetical protein